MRRRLLWFLLGIGGAAIGLLPWLVHGGRLPLQNLAAGTDPSAVQPVVLLPFSQYLVVLIASTVVEGGAIAGLLSRFDRRPADLPARALLVVGLVLAQSAATVQAATAARGVLRQGSESAVYLGALVAGTVLSMLVGVVVVVLVTARSRAAVVVGVALAAPLAEQWVDGLLVEPFGGGGAPALLVALARMLPAVAVGLVIGWSGLRTPGRIAAAVFSLLALWLGSSLITAIASAAGTRVLARDPAGMLQFGAIVFRSSLGQPDVLLPMLVVVVVVAVLGMLLRVIVGRRRRRRAEGADSGAYSAD